MFLDAGLIPAHAGKTSQLAEARADLAAHPRSRGENHNHLLGQVERLGSSPLTRGKPLQISSITVVIRLIPAHAGKTAHR